MNTRGVLAELRAVGYLRRHGYRIRHLRWRGGGGEIDLVAEENGLTVFVEVKSSPRLGDGAQRVDRGRSHICAQPLRHICGRTAWKTAVLISSKRVTRASA